MFSGSLRQKLLTLIGIAQISLILVSIYSLYKIVGQSTHSIDSLGLNIEQVETISHIKAEFGKQIQEWKNTIIRGEKKEDNEKHFDAFKKSAGTIIEKSDKLKSLLPSNKAAIIEDFKNRQLDLVSKYKESHTLYLNPTNFNPKEADKFVKGKDRNVSDGLLELEKQISVESIQEAKATIKKSEQITIVILLLASAIVFTISLLYISKVVKTINDISNGLKSTFSSVINSTEKMHEVSLVLDQASHEQAASLQETTSSMEEINSMIQETTSNSLEMQKVSEAGLTAAKKGQSVIQDMLTSMRDIQDNNGSVISFVNQTNAEIARMNDMIKEIEQKTAIINDIVFQTKLLSFNASVEAARAGEQGKGFAVVAEEVGNLAKMSGDASKEISELIDKSTKTVEEIMLKTKSSIDTVEKNSLQSIEKGIAISNACSSEFSKIMENTQVVTSKIIEVTTATQEQSKGVSEVNKAVSQLDELTHKNTQLAQDCSRTADDLKNQSVELDGYVTKLMSILHGSESSV